MLLVCTRSSVSLKETRSVVHMYTLHFRLVALAEENPELQRRHRLAVIFNNVYNTVASCRGQSVPPLSLFVCWLLHQLACAHDCSSPTGCVSCGEFISLPQDRGCDRASTILLVLNTHAHIQRCTHSRGGKHIHTNVCYFLMCNLQLFMPSSGVCFGLLGTL